MAQQLERLRTALADQYRIERELGQGGMAVVYLAEDLKHHRSVALKVLRPELARILGPDRFLREIAIAAGLRHPHLLPLYDSGIIESGQGTEAVPYYVMPFVEGTTLRDRITAEKQLPVDLAVRLTRELADALAYAHRHGVVHRDVKPENIYLDEGRALLADFGIAKAVNAAAPGGNAAATTAGTVIGTVTYMSPEQAAGSGDLDGRSDQYSLACVLHEMLAGQPPFTGPTPESVITQHMVAQPPEISGIRPAAAGPISVALRKALSKAPADRFPSMEEFAAALAAPSAEVAVPRAPFLARRRWIPITGAAVLIVFAVALFKLLGQKPAGGPDPHRLAVIPFEVLDSSLALWAEGAVDYLSPILDGAGPLVTVPRAVVIKRWKGKADPTSVAEFGRSTNAGLALYGSIVTAGHDSIRISATVLDVPRGRPLGEVEIRGDRERMDQTLDSLAVMVLREIGRNRPVGAVRSSHIGSRSLPALKTFLQAEQHFRKAEYDSAIPLYRQAVALDSGFALAWWHLGTALGWRDLPSRIELQRAGILNHGLSQRDSLLIAADSALAGAGNTWEKSGARVRRIAALQEEALRRYPDDPEAWYRYADVRYHQPAAFSVTAREVQQALARAVSLDSGLAEPFQHLVWLTLSLDPPESALPVLDAFRRHFPKLPEYDLARRLLDPRLTATRSTEAFMDSLPHSSLKPAVWILSMFPDSQENAVRVARAMKPTTGVTEVEVRWWVGTQLRNRGHLRDGATMIREAWFWESELALAGIISRDSAELLMRGWSESTNYWFRYQRLRWQALTGDSGAVRRDLPLLDKHASREPGPYDLAASEQRLSISAYHALARRDTTLALALFHQITDTLCVECFLEKDILVRLHAGRGELRQAWEIASRRGAENLLSFTYYDGLARLDRARLAEQLGKREEAIEDYHFLAAMWRNADPELQKYVTEAKEGLARLSAEPR